MRHAPDESSSRSATTELLQALRFAAIKHRGQRRKDAERSPYVNHVIDVAALLAEEGEVDDPATLIAAVLHDTVEDTETSLDEIERQFGSEVRDIVDELTDDTRLPKQERKDLQVKHAPHASPKAKLIKLADKIVNVTDLASSPPADWTLHRRAGYFDWAELVVAGLRGTNAALESRFDRMLELGRAAVLAAHAKAEQRR
jgi:guanosine-3',5'-bis(diphosphate) 3'-pyrophosphohydrolase